MKKIILIRVQDSVVIEIYKVEVGVQQEVIIMQPMEDCIIKEVKVQVYNVVM